MADHAHPVTDDRWIEDLMSGPDLAGAPVTRSAAVTDEEFTEVAADEEFIADGDGDLVAAAAAVDATDLTAADQAVDAVVDLDAGSPPPDDVADGQADAGARKAAIGLGAAVVVAITGIVAALVMFSDDSEPSVDQVLSPTAAAPVNAPQPVPTSAAPAVPQDQSIPFNASAPCAAGSTSAQSLTDTASDSAWVCARGSRDETLEGKVLTVDFGMTHMLSGVEATTGWVAKTPGGKDNWLQHRVVTRLQFIFLNGNVVSDIFTLDTGNVHGPVTAALPRRVLASRVNVVVLQTSRPPTSPVPASDPAGLPEGQPGLLDSFLGEGGAPLSDPSQDSGPYPDLTMPDSGTDPVDNSFAMSSLKFFGYRP